MLSYQNLSGQHPSASEHTNMKKYKYCLICLLICLCPISGIATNLPDVVPFQYDQELSSCPITSICQDITGQIWITSREHLYCFDGYQVNKLNLPPHPSVTVQTEIQSIYSDSKNRIWIGTGSCIYSYDQKQQLFTHYFPEPEDILNMSNVIYQIAEAPSGNLFFATRNGIFKLNEITNTLERLESFPWHKICSGDRKHERITLSLHITSTDILWGGTQGDGVWRINLKDGKSTHFKPDKNDPTSLNGKYIYTIYEDEFGVIWLGTENGLSAFQKESSTFINISLPNISGGITTICENENNDLLLGSSQGIYCYKRRNKEIHHLKITSYPRLSSFSNTVSTLKKDRSGGLWVGTLKGLARSYPAPDFSLLKHSGQDKNSIYSNKISFLTADSTNSKLWIVYSKGVVDCYNPVDKTIKHYFLQDIGIQYTSPLMSYLTPDQELIIGTSGGLLHFNSTKDRFEPLQFTFSNQDFKNTYAILKDRQKNYWLGVLDVGVFQINLQQQSCKRIPISYEKIHKNIYTNIKTLYEDYQGNIWIVFWRAGILRYNPQTGEEKLFTQENTHGLLPNNTIWEVKEDQENRLVLTTANGIAIWDPLQEKFVEYPCIKNLEESVVGWEENRYTSQWWLSTTRGIICLNLTDNNFIRYTEPDGLQGNTFNPKATAQLDSLFFFGGDYGLNIINTNQSASNRYVPHPSLTRIIINGIETIPTLLPIKNGLPYLKLKKGENVEIYFSSFSYCKEWRNYYKAGFTTNDSISLKIPQQNNNVIFTATHSGTFPFVLTASNSDGIWSIPQTMLYIEVDNPYLLHLVIFVLLCLIGTFFYYRKTIRQIPGKLKQTKTKASLQLDVRTLQLKQKFEILMEKDQVYLNKRFSKTELASQLKLSEQQLRLFLKNYYGKSFPELINHYRVEAVKQKMKNPQTKDYTLFALGEECGFNSRSSFYRVFKEYTGLTPAEYQEQLKQ